MLRWYHECLGYYWEVALHKSFSKIYYWNVWSDVIFPELLWYGQKLLTNWKTFSNVWMIKQASNFYMYNYFQLQLHRSEQTEIRTKVINGWVVRLEICQTFLWEQNSLHGTKNSFLICNETFFASRVS